jgi:MFS family permease
VVAPNLLVLGITRVVTGACFAGVIPTALVYVGDVWPAATRQRPVSEVLTASATGIAIATVGAGVVADLVGWRAVPGLSAAAAAALVVALRRLPEPERPQAAGHPLRSIRTVFASGWGRLVLAVVLAEGVVVLGVLTYVAPAVQALGRSTAVAGLVAASFGVGAVACSRMVRALVERVSSPGIAAIGGLCLVAGVGRARGVGVGLDAGRRRVRRRRLVGVPAHHPADVGHGDGAGRAGDVGRAVRRRRCSWAARSAPPVAAPAAEAGAYAAVFAWSAVGSVPVALAAWWGRSRWVRTR